MLFKSGDTLKRMLEEVTCSNIMNKIPEIHRICLMLPVTLIPTLVQKANEKGAEAPSPHNGKRATVVRAVCLIISSSVCAFTKVQWHMPVE